MTTSNSWWRYRGRLIGNHNNIYLIPPEMLITIWFCGSVAHWWSSYKPVVTNSSDYFIPPKMLQLFSWQIPQCTCFISHNAPFRTEICTFLFWMVHCGIWDGWTVGLVNLVSQFSSSNRPILIIYLQFSYVENNWCHNTIVNNNHSPW